MFTSAFYRKTNQFLHVDSEIVQRGLEIGPLRALLRGGALGLDPLGSAERHSACVEAKNARRVFHCPNGLVAGFFRFRPRVRNWPHEIFQKCEGVDLGLQRGQKILKRLSRDGM